jgi:L-methionine (R)-S-oxide reductase
MGEERTLGELSALAGRRDAAVWREAAERIQQARGYRWVGLYDVTPTEIAALAWTGSEAPAYPRFPRDKGLNGAAVASREVVIAQDVATDPRYLTAFATTGAEAIAPVAGDDGEVVGTIDVESDRPHAFRPEDELFLRAAAVALRPLWRHASRGDV